jgi:hypothetical protein
MAGKNDLLSGGVCIAEGKRPTIVGYKILADLGHGGMGSVYKARQESLNRVVALKVIRTAAQADPRHLARFRVEAEAAARLQNPNIVQIYEVGQQEGLPYLAMEYVPGGTLAQQLNGLPRPGREAASVAEVLARAMHYAHIHGVVHRDRLAALVFFAGIAYLLPRPPGQDPFYYWTRGWPMLLSLIGLACLIVALLWTAVVLVVYVFPR